jgi:TatD DNase family protein
MLVDTHAHLDARHFRQDLPQVISSAAAAGVKKIVAIGCDVPSSRAALEIAERFEGVYAAVGVHPCYVLEVTETDWLAQIETMAQHAKCVAIGEIGLDEYHAPPKASSAEAYHGRQREFFEGQLDLAARVGKNIVVHQRNCFEKATLMVKNYAGRLRAQFHCFINSLADAEPLLADGHVISFTGIATYPKAPEVLECARDVPAGYFMLETDAPYLSPQATRKLRNEPAFVRHTAESIAAARGISLPELAEITTRTAEAFFTFPQ